MATQSRNLVARIDGDVSGFTKAVKSAEQSAKTFERELKKLETRQTQSVAHVTQMRSRYEAQAARQEAEAARAMERASAKRMQAMDQVGKAGLAMGAAMAAGVALSVRAAAQWESAWAGVAKTVDGNAKQMAVLEGELRNLARTLPASHKEIAAVAEAAGQLGIKREAIAGFSKVMIDLGETTNLTADQAATAMAQIANIMGTAPEEIDRMGAALVALGNNGASTEADIVQMALRISGAGKQIGLAESDVFAMANALASVGINAEAGGSAISRFMMDVSVGVETGSGAVKDFADVAGMGVEEFSRLFREDAANAVGAFTDGLGRIQAAGGSAIVTLENMGITEIRMRDALLRLAGAQGLLSASVDLGRESWEANNALVDEANKRYQTTEARMQVAKNAVNDLAIDVGSTLLPALAGAADGLADMAGFLAGLPAPVKNAVAVIGTLGAIVGLAGGSALIAVPKIVAFKASVDALAISAPRAAGAVGMLGKAMGVAGIAAAAAAVGYALGKLAENLLQRDAPALDAFTTSLRDFANDGRLTGDAADRLGDQFGKLGHVLDVANSNKINIFDGNGALQINEARDLLTGLDETLAGLVASGNADQATATFDALARRAAEAGVPIEDLTKWLPEYGDAQRAAGAATDTGTIAAQAMADAVGGIDENLTNAYSSLGAWAEAQGMSEEATKSLTKQIEGWAQSIADFVQPLGAYTDLLKEKETAERESAEKTAAATESQKDSWEDYADAVDVSVGEYLERLREQVEAQEQWQQNMTLLAGRVSQSTLDELARMGPEGAPLVAQLVDASGEQLAELEDLFGRRTADATGAMAAELYLANTLLPRIAALVGENTARALATALANGTTTVAKIAADYAWALEGGLAPLLSSLGAAKVQSLVRQENAQAGRPRQGATSPVPRGYADGGIEDHVAQIAQPGVVPRVWAERETEGEAYIPLARSKRQRSLAIWQETGRRLGVFADGGFHAFRTESDVPRPYGTSPFGPPISTAADGTMGVAYAEAVEFIKRNSLAAAGNLVELGRRLQQMGFRVSGHAAFGGTPTSGHAPGSYHYRNRAIDVNYGPGGQSAAEMAAIDALMPKLNGLNLTEKIWRAPGHFDHLHLAMAQGGLLNPHIRDSGGPLLPGYTFNGTGAPEMVLPMASGGIHGGAVSASDPRSLTTAANVAAAMGNMAEVQRLIASWRAYNEELERATRLRELLADEAQARADIQAAKTTEEAARAQAELNRAMQATTDFQYAAAREAEASAVERLVAAMEAEAEANRKANAERRTRQDNKHELGLISDKDYLEILQRRMDDEQRYSDAWMALWRERESVLKDQAAAEARLTDALRGEVEERLGILDRLLDQETAIRSRMAQSAEELRSQQSQLAKQGVELARRYGQDQADLREEQAKAEREHLDRMAGLGRQFTDDQARILADRRDRLANATALDQAIDFRRGLPADWLIRNAQRQVEALSEWMDELDLARRMGVSEAVIEALGLDEGPQALAQVRALTRATAGQIDDLNRAVQDRTRAAGEQVRREQVGNYGQLGEQLVAAQQQYAAAVLQAQADYRAGQERFAAEMLTLQTRYSKDRQSLAEQQAALQAEFLAEQQALSAELAAIGQEQGRSYAEAIAEGMRSQIPAVRAAAKALADAMAALDKANAAAPESAPVKADVNGILPGPFKRRGVRRATYDDGGWLQPGYTLAYNGTGSPERVLTAGQMGGRTVNVMPNAKVTIREMVDVDLLAQRAEFLVAVGSF